MRKIYFIALILLSGYISAQNPGRLDFSVTTANIPGKYADRHILAIWVEDASGNYINSMAVYASRRIKYLVSWNSISGGNKADAVTGATQKPFKTYNVNWNLKDLNGNVVEPGKYIIWMEATSRNSAGVKYSVEVTVGNDNYSATPAGNNYFKNLSITFTASDNSAIKELSENNQFKVYPNPTSGELNLEIFNTQTEWGEIQVLDMKGTCCEVLYKGIFKTGENKFSFRLSDNLPLGNYILTADMKEIVWSKQIVLK